MDEQVLKELFWEWSEQNKWRGFDAMIVDPLTMLKYVEAYNLQVTAPYKTAATVCNYMMKMRKQGRLSAKECPRYGKSTTLYG